MNGESSALYIPAPWGCQWQVASFSRALPLWCCSPSSDLGVAMCCWQIWPYRAQEMAGYGKIYPTPLSFLGCGILSPGFPPTHSVSPYLQTCLAKSCFALVLFFAVGSSFCVSPLLPSAAGRRGKWDTVL